MSNTGASPTSGPIAVTDSLPSGLTSTAATGAGWSCTAGGQSVTCTRSDPLAPGASSPITLTVEVAANAPASVTNTAMVAGGGDVDSSNNSASDPTTIIAVPDLTITKTHTGSFLQGQVGATYTLTATNTGGGPTSGVVTVSDTLPAGLTPTAAAGGGWVCNIAGQAVSCTRSDALNVGAGYPAITLTVNVAPAAPPSLTNTATVSGGGESNAVNSTASDITTIGPGPDLSITKSHTGNFLQGQTGAIYTITVSNPGSPPTTGVVTVTDNVPAGLIPISAVGPGWICSVSGQDMTCTRSDPLATGQSYPPITLTVNVQPGAPGSVTNAATVSGGGDVNPANNSATDVTTIIPGADLTITKSHTGNFTQGQTGATYTVTVTNSGAGPTTTQVAVTDTFPLGLTPTAAAGAGWSCTAGAQTVGCSRSDPLAAGASYPPITITLNVASDAPATVTNVGGVSGGGDSNAANNTASDATTIMAGADLTVTKTHTGNFTQGQRGASYTIIVGNSGGTPTSSQVTVIDVVPTGLVPFSATGTGWVCDLIGQAITCVRSDPLSPGAAYPPITVTVDVAANAPASVTNSARVTGGGDTNPANNTIDDVTTIAPGPDLTITKTHTAVFTQGQRATPALGYTLTAQNVGASPTTGTVTLIDSVPPGLMPVSASGTGWTCGISPQSVTCTRSDALSPSASYPPVMLTVDVESDAPASVINTATIAGGGDVNTSNNTASDPTQINSGQNLAISKSHTGTLAQGQRGVPYTITVTNGGGAPTLGTVTLIDTVPTGLFPTAGTGTGWTCTVSGQTVNCTRGDPLAGGASYPPVTITVDVAADAPASITNRAIVAGGGDVLSLNNVADDSAAVAGGPDLTIVKTHPRGFGPGQAGVLHPHGDQPWRNADGRPRQCCRRSPGRADSENGERSRLDVRSLKRHSGLFPVRRTCAGSQLSVDHAQRSRRPRPRRRVDADQQGHGLTRRGRQADNNTAEDSASSSPGTGCDVNGDGLNEIVTWAGPGGGPHVNVWTLAGGAVTYLASFYAYDTRVRRRRVRRMRRPRRRRTRGRHHRRRTRAAAPGARLQPAARYAVEIASFFAYDPAFGGGVRVAAGDVDGDGRADIITGAGAGAARMCGRSVWRAASPRSPVSMPMTPRSPTGCWWQRRRDGRRPRGHHHRDVSLRRPCACLSRRSGRVSEVHFFRTSLHSRDRFASPPRTSTATAWPTSSPARDRRRSARAGVRRHRRCAGRLREFYAYDPLWCDIDPSVNPVQCDGVYVGGGDVNGDGVGEVITGTNRQGGPLRVFRIGAGVTELLNFFPYFDRFQGPVRVAP